VHDWSTRFPNTLRGGSKDKSDLVELEANFRFYVQEICPTEIAEVAEGEQSKMMYLRDHMHDSSLAIEKLPLYLNNVFGPYIV
jgi:hypothetical protein